MGLLDFLHGQKLHSVVQKMGYVTDQDGIMSRYMREKAGWDEHLNRSKQTILDAVTFYKAETVTILGSGWLLDVPLKELSERCQKVYLYDIFHPPLIQQKVKKFANIELIAADITGGSIEKTWQMGEEYKNIGLLPDLSQCIGKGFVPDHDPGLVISLNILNQLDTLVCDYVLSFAHYWGNEINEYKIEIQQNHLNTITKYLYCLISDCEEIVEDIVENTIEMKQLVLVPFPIAEHNDNWIWKFDASGMYYPQKKVSFTVKACY